ncbi:MAG: hypothetical protein J0I09_08085 [Sphingobacteriia bacterium]|nr:hypothetical protein [Sphingobacteriia bacterium]
MDVIKYKNINDHVFFIVLLKELAKVGKGTRKGAKQRYIFNVNHEVVAIKRSFETLQIARILVAEQHPQINKFSSAVKPADFLRYNIENYFLRITVYSDLVLSLINQVYQWNIKKDLSFKKNLGVKARETDNIPVKKIIRQLDKLMKNVKPIRNRIAHEGSLRSDIVLLEASDQIEDATPGQGISKEQRDLLFKQMIESNLQEMLAIEEDLATDLLLVFDTIYPVFMAGLTQ